jgi:hypothetical protein
MAELPLVRGPMPISQPKCITGSRRRATGGDPRNGRRSVSGADDLAEFRRSEKRKRAFGEDKSSFPVVPDDIAFGQGGAPLSPYRAHPEVRSRFPAKGPLCCSPCGLGRAHLREKRSEPLPCGSAGSSATEPANQTAYTAFSRPSSIRIVLMPSAYGLFW